MGIDSTDASKAYWGWSKQ
jgi:hypothetical protein